jgi:hypothetical protein
MLHRQPSSKDRARKSWETILGSRYFGPAKVVKERVGWGRAADFVAFDCTCQEKLAYGHVAYAVQEVSKTASKEAQNGTLCPGNERCSVIHWNRPKNAVMPCQAYLETHR